MPSNELPLDEIRRLRSRRTAADQNLYAAQLRLQKALAADAKFRRGETRTDDGRDAKPDIEELKRKYQKARKDLAGVRDELHATIGTRVPPHPRDLLPKLHDDVPFLLLPLRIETRFVTQGEKTELRVRVYPDDIAIHTHETALSDKEVEAGAKYWLELWPLGASGTTGEDTRKKAWSFLADKFGGARAAWIAHETRPLNWETQPRPQQPTFRVHDLTKTSAWSRAPRTRVLPDRLMLLLYRGTEVAHEIPGNLIPDELFVGPDPLEVDEAFDTPKDGKIAFGSSFAWASDFDKAETAGMAFRVDLTPQEARTGFSKVLVIGVMGSADAADAGTMVEELIDNHHYSPKGFALVRQGTPTNNTDASASGFTTSDPFNAGSYYVDTGEPLFTEDDDTDGRILADALGIRYAPLQFVANADATDHAEAVAMNTALYPGTLGYYFETMLAPVLDAGARERLREHFIRTVSGRGPLPAIRVGNQPYGILLTSDFNRWQWSREELGRDPRFLPTLQATLNKYHAVWLELLSSVAHIGRPGESADPEALLMEVLGLQAGSVAFNQRIAYSTDYLINRDAFQYGGRYFDDVQETFSSKQLLLTFLRSLGYGAAETGALAVPQMLRLVFQHFHTPLDAANLVDNVPLSEEKLIRYYDEPHEKNYLDWLAETATVDALERQDFGGPQAPNALLFAMLRRALLLQLHASAVRWFGSHDVDLSPTLAATNFYNIRPQPDLSKWEVMRAPVAVGVAAHEFRERPIGDYLLTAGRNQSEAEYLTRMRAALKVLADLPTARLERLLTEHVDTCTYRLDSWQTAMFSLRLDRQHRDDQGEGRRGIFLGAVGWVEGLRPAARTEVPRDEVPAKLQPPAGEAVFEYARNGGFVHAPSLNHATAAAVLRSGYLNHASSTKPDTMSVNLSSERVRRALFLLQGVRNGQPLEALLGYQFERDLHDAASADTAQIKLNEYIYDFRDRFPLERHYVQQQGTSAAVDAIPPNNVVNGVRLAESTGDVPYGATGSVASASTAERATIRRAKDRLADSLDAVKDLLLSEGVFQLVQGNVDRAGAVLTALKDTNVPPEMDVINTPRGSQFSFTNRVTVQFPPLDPALPANNPWGGAMTPRAIMEPGLNQWMGAILGTPATLVCRVSHADDAGNELDSENISAAHLALQPIDLVYLVGVELNTGVGSSGEENRTAASELEVRIAWAYRDLKALADDVRVRIEFLQPANSRTFGKYLLLLRQLKTLISESRPLHALDFDPPSKKSAAQPANPENYLLAEFALRVQQALDARTTIATALNNLPIDAVVADENGIDQHFATLKASFDALTAAKLAFKDITVTFADVDAPTLQDLLHKASGLGMADAFPVARVVSEASKVALLEQARSVSRRLEAMRVEADGFKNQVGAATVTAEKVRLLLAAGKAVLGGGFAILPQFNYNNETDVQASDGDRVQLLKHAVNELDMVYPADEWLQNVSHVRPRTARWNSILSLHEAFTGDRLALLPVQLPFRAKDSWLAVEFPDKDPQQPDEPFNIMHDTLSVTTHGDAAFANGVARSGLLIDDWTELIPTREEITGIAFNYDQPAAAPPQALLLAVAPQLKGHWTWEDLLGVVNDTLTRAKLRAVEPKHLDTKSNPEVNILLPAILADFSQVDINLALDFRSIIREVRDSAPIQVIAQAHP